MWTNLGKIKHGQKDLFNDMIRKYQQPIAKFLMLRGFKIYEAEDICQETFIQITSDNFLSQADKDKGKFRSLILSVVKNLSYNYLKKNNSRKKKETAAMESSTDHMTDESFNECWAFNIIQDALDKLKAISQESKVPYYDIIYLRFFDNLSFEDIRIKLGLGEKELRNHTKYANRKIKCIILDLIKQYCSSLDEFQHEVQSLSKYWEF